MNLLPVTYIKDFLPTSVADDAFASLRQLPWNRRGDVPRMEYFTSKTGRPYTYGKGDFARTYEPDADDYTVDALGLLVRMHAPDSVRIPFELCLLNRYLDQSQHLGWHSDDSPEIDVTRPIAIISLGVEREIWFRRIPGVRDAIGGSLKPVVTKLKLAHGSLCVMHAGMQQTHQHRIPKAGFQCGERISLTYRGAAHE